MEELLRVYDEQSQYASLTITIQELRSGIHRWRVHILAKGVAKERNDDTEVICIENENRQQALKEAAALLPKRMQDVLSMGGR